MKGIILATPKPPKRVKPDKIADGVLADPDELDKALRERHRRLRGTDDSSPTVIDEGEPDKLVARLQAASLFDDEDEKS